MGPFIRTAGLLLVLLSAQFADAHGTPIVVGQSGGVLTVSGGLSDDEGFAPQISVQDDEDGDPFASVNIPGVGPAIVWQIPGFNISGLNNQSSLSIEVIVRSVNGSNPLEERILWYWDPQTELVEPAASDFYLLGTGMRRVTLSPDDTEAPPPLLLANSLSGQQNFHNHGLLSFALDDDPLASAGAYGFFARLTSNQYAASNPFLIVLNYDVDYEQMVDAALAINAAAADSDSLPGDFNHDGTVDAADYVVWRKSLGSAPDFEVWRGNFGASSDGSGAIATATGSSAASPSVPEPLALPVIAVMISALLMSRRVPWPLL